MQPLHGQKVAVVGGGSGIGRATALLAAGAGAEVVIGGRTAAKLDAVAAEAGARQITAAVGDHTDPVSVERFATAVEPRDHLVVTRPWASAAASPRSRSSGPASSSRASCSARGGWCARSCRSSARAARCPCSPAC